MCGSLSEIILPENGILEVLYGGCFSNSIIESIKLPKSLKYMYSSTEISNTGPFSKCTKLREVLFYSDNNLIHVDAYSFGSTDLEEFEIGPNLEYIIGGTFESIKTSFKRIKMRSSNPYYYVHNDMLYNGTKLVICPPSVAKLELLDIFLVLLKRWLF